MFTCLLSLFICLLDDHKKKTYTKEQLEYAKQMKPISDKSREIYEWHLKFFGLK